MASKVANSVGLKFPRVNNPPSYIKFLNGIKSSPANAKLLASAEKPVVDAEFESQLRSNTLYDETTIQRCLDKTRTKSARELWQKWRSPASDHQPAPRTKDLNLPRFGIDVRKDTGSDIWNAQRYEDFASRLTKANPNVEFDKKLMDEAFRTVVKMHPGSKDRGSYDRGGHDRMLKRCLGKESDKYWDVKKV